MSVPFFLIINLNINHLSRSYAILWKKHPVHAHSKHHRATAHGWCMHVENMLYPLTCSCLCFFVFFFFIQIFFSIAFSTCFYVYIVHDWVSLCRRAHFVLKHSFVLFAFARDANSNTYYSSASHKMCAAVRLFCGKCKFFCLF